MAAIFVQERLSTKSYADIIVPNGGKNKVALDIINSELLPMMEDKIKDADH